ncbi:hypothetical protein CCR75_000922 [Bremia lactucae]|uniref:Uncharacterized protein n=1 Tax=Bremia lactucae TaxID=4779 RepID=A0A976FLQ4_BRELC|nr:hypothetical protein CCR75_000922 [Bremia lactucae]
MDSDTSSGDEVLKLVWSREETKTSDVRAIANCSEVKSRRSGFKRHSRQRVNLGRKFIAAPPTIFETING